MELYLQSKTQIEIIKQIGNAFLLSGTHSSVTQIQLDEVGASHTQQKSPRSSLLQTLSFIPGLDAIINPEGQGMGQGVTVGEGVGEEDGGS